METDMVVTDNKPATEATTSALRTLAIEVKALESLTGAFDDGALSAQFDAAADIIVKSTGRVIVTGMGKSGLIGRKISATFASTGTPSFFIHPGEASHGDLGMVTTDDVVIALSWSGETAELSDILTFCRRFDVPLIAITSRLDSALGKRSTVCLTLPRVQEACPNDLAPTSSTIMMLAIGDALAVALIELRGFSAADFRIFHPGGKLGAQLMTVQDMMATGDDVPRVSGNATILDATIEMTRKRFGITAVVDDAGLLIGAFTDGDLRRNVAAGTVEECVNTQMTLHPLYANPQMLASEALAIMNKHTISQLFVCDGMTLCGIIHLHDILRAGVV
ncbi:hypothetical protein ASE75_04820 [Sphingomonas sp. Leaf17]|nr:hypothetical protein ASE75_04820 [Sphingomonas sp. Leaf17]